MIETALWGASAETRWGPGAMCHGNHPLHVFICPMAKTHVSGTAHAAVCRGFSCKLPWSSAIFQVHGALSFHSQLMAGEIQCPRLFRLQIELLETPPALTQLQQGLGFLPLGFQPISPPVLPSSPPLRDRGVQGSCDCYPGMTWLLALNAPLPAPYPSALKQLRRNI